ncbi:MAG: YbhB/YbcL family Raf kinase inhibitor-like protein [Nitrospiraceae bacterium]|nr:YbhB/YbcL family Raf kinase inhibitor-like protein [Nitrospiraceae bacterium]
MKIRKRPLLLLSLLVVFVGIQISEAFTAKEATKMSELTISSPAFGHNGNIPAKHTCDGKDVNPSLAIRNVPPGAKSLALIVDDPDAPAGTWVHWVLWNIAPETSEIKEDSVPKGAIQGINDFRKHAYGGPCPPSGTHRYFFKLYALDALLNPGPNSSKAEIEKAMQGHIISQAEIIGLYKRK